MPSLIQVEDIPGTLTYLMLKTLPQVTKYDPFPLTFSDIIDLLWEGSYELAVYRVDNVFHAWSIFHEDGKVLFIRYGWASKRDPRIRSQMLKFLRQQARTRGLKGLALMSPRKGWNRWFKEIGRVYYQDA